MGTEKITRLLAEFMGAKKVKEEDYEMPHGSHHICTLVQWSVPEGLSFEQAREAKEGRFKYDRSWDWLFTVINKIESLGFDVSICRNSIQIHRRLAVDHQYDQSNLIVEESEIYDDFVGEDKLFATFTVCARFIEWYNNQKKRN
jgi:hypothetical protein